MNRPLSLLITALVGPPAGPLAAQATASHPKVVLTPCKLPGIVGAARCGTLKVFENRAAAAGRTIGIQFVVLKATGTAHASEAIFNFAGGPGAAATQDVGGIAEGMAELRSTRDLVAIDIRGTGLSAPLNCPSLAGNRGVQGFLDDFMPANRVAACLLLLQKDHDLRFYTTSLAMDDVEDVRAALGYDQVDLMGASYGTRSALVYMRQHPTHVRAALLEGVAPTGDRSPLTFARDAQASLDQVLAACAADARCHAAFPDPAADLQSALDATDRAPVQVALTNPSNRQTVALRLSRNGLAQALRYMLYSPSTHAMIPLYLHEAARGNFRPLAQIAQAFGGLFGSASDGYFLSVTCSEDVRFFSLEEAAAAAHDTFLGDFRARKQKAACAEWPTGDLPAGYGEAVRSSIPTLLLSGERDPVTPVRWAAEAARTLPNGLHIIVPGGAHGNGGLDGADCVDRLEVAFLRRCSVAGLDTSCVSTIRTPPFATKLAPVQN